MDPFNFLLGLIGLFLAIVWAIFPFVVFKRLKQMLVIMERSESMLYSIDKGVSNLEAKSRDAESVS